MASAESIGVALALSAAAGLDLYLIALLAAVAVRLGWFAEPALSGLAPVALAPVMAVALILFLVGFFIDKTPRLDSLWDWPHWLARPAGGALLAGWALGGAPWGFALGAAAALLAHAAKALLRRRVNRSREPLSNVAVSAAEFGLVIGAFSLAVHAPTAALAVVGAVLLGLCASIAAALRRRGAPRAAGADLSA